MMRGSKEALSTCQAHMTGVGVMVPPFLSLPATVLINLSPSLHSAILSDSNLQSACSSLHLPTYSTAASAIRQ